MVLLWKHGEGTVRSVTDRLTGEKRPAYTTVMTVMVRLADKGLLVRKLVGRAYVYGPAKTEQQFLAEASQSRVRQLVKDYGDLALAQFAEEIEKVSPERLERLAELLQRRDRS